MVQALGNWEFELFVAGETPKARVAFGNLKKICDRYLSKRYQIVVFDICENPKLAIDNEIMATPTIIRKKPLPKKTLIGDLTNMDRAISRLELQ